MIRALRGVLCFGILFMGENAIASASSNVKLSNPFALLDEGAQDTQDATSAAPSFPSSSQAFHKPGRRAKGKGKNARGASSLMSAPAARLSPPDALNLAKLYVTQSAQKEGDLALLGKVISLASKYADMRDTSPFNDVRAKASLALGKRLNQGSVTRTTIDGQIYLSHTCYTWVHAYAKLSQKKDLLHEALLGLVESTSLAQIELDGTHVHACDLCVQVYEEAAKYSSLAVRALKGALSSWRGESYTIKGRPHTIDDVLGLAYHAANNTEDREAAARCYWIMGQCIGEQRLPEHFFLAKSDFFTLCAQNTNAPLPKARAFLLATEARLGESPKPGSLSLKNLRAQVEGAQRTAITHRDKGLRNNADDLLKRIEILEKSQGSRAPTYSFRHYSDPID